MDLVAGLHWLRENLPAFGGNPEKVTLMGHGTGAALANFLAVSPVARGAPLYLLKSKIFYFKQKILCGAIIFLKRLTLGY